MVKVSNEEIKNMAKMYEWADRQPDMVTFSLTFVKPNTHHTEKRFCLSSLEWINESWHHVKGEGKTIYEAMENYARKRN